MCGVVGFIDFKKRTEQAVLQMLVDALQHRGPDDQGIYQSDEPGFQLGLGHSRLSIQDVSVQGHQPMASACARYTLVYNGEIYNFKMLRQSLMQSGSTFSSESDTEVILELFRRYGVEKSLDQLRGMFAMACFDHEEQALYLIRDRFGVKPLYYYWHDGIFVFSSELKALVKHPRVTSRVDQQAVQMFLMSGYVPTPFSIYEHTHKLKPGHMLALKTKTQSVDTSAYWMLFAHYNRPKLDLSYEEALSTVEAALIEAFEMRMVADVPVGVFFSGGYDSTAVAAVLQSRMTTQINTFTIGFEEPAYNEAKHARALAAHIGSNHHEYYFSEDDALDLVPSLPTVYDEPFGDSSALPTIILSRFAREHVKVALSADGGDEIFAGYLKYFGYHKLAMLDALPYGVRKALSLLLAPAHHLPGLRSRYLIQANLERLRGYLCGRTVDDRLGCILAPRFFGTSELKRLLSCVDQDVWRDTYFNCWGALSEVNDALAKMQAIDKLTYLQDDILVKVDRATMSVGLEGREPMLDHQVVELVSRLPSSFKAQGAYTKRLLKDIVHKYVPRELVDKPKKGFSVPLESWLRGRLKEQVLDTFHGAYPDFLDRQGAHGLLADFYRGRKLCGEQLWFLFVYLQWHQHSHK